MSLRKSPQLSPELLAAARRNARRSTGPRSPAAKQNSKLNALKHGAYVSAENRRASLRVLGEDTEKFEALREELMSAFGASDAFLEKQVEDLAWLYWRRDRLERTLSGLKRRALQRIEEWQHRRRQEMAGVTFDASRHELVDWDLIASSDRGVTLRLRLSYLGVILDQVKQGISRPRQEVVLKSVYRGGMGWRPKVIYALLWRFSAAAERAKEEAKHPHSAEYPRESGQWEEPLGEAEQQELLRLLGEEIASAEEELAYEEKANEERAAIERDACLAPQDEAWCILLRQEGSLDRSIDRKVRILLRMRKESAGLADVPGGGAQRESVEEPAGSTPENADLVEANANIKMKERRGNVPENKGRRLESRPASRRVLEQTGGYLEPGGMAPGGQGVIQGNGSCMGLRGATT